MLLFILVVTLFIVSATVAWHFRDSYKHMLLDSISFGIAVILAAIVGVMGFVAGVNNFYNVEANKEALNYQYEFLNYQVKLDTYGELDDMSQYKLMNDIYEWNSDLMRYNRQNESPWVGMFIPDYITQYELIDHHIYDTE